ncbi:MAG: TubC N-terminal docking domain-related protein [Dethiobacteraceae bacterium]
MTAQELLNKLTGAGCRVRLDGEQLKVTGNLTAEQRELIREHKPGLVKHLKQQAFVQNLCRWMDATGVARFHSARLQEPVYVVRNRDSLPSLPEDALVFTLMELQNMMGLSYTDEELQALAQAKRELLAAHRQSLDDPLATVEDALKIFPGSQVMDATISAGNRCD